MKKRYILIALIIPVLIIFPLSFFMFAANTETEKDIFQTLDDFSDLSEWRYNGEAGGISTTVSDNQTCLVIDGAAGPAGYDTSAQRNGFMDKTDEECSAVAFSVCLTTEAGLKGNFSLSASVTANGKEYTVTTGLAADEWSKIFIKTDTLKVKDLTSVKIQCSALSTTEQAAYRLMISPIKSASSQYEQITERFFCGYYDAKNADISYGSDGFHMNITSGSADSSVTGGAIAAYTEESVNALRFDIASCSRSCDITLSWSYSSSGDFKEGDSYTFTAERASDSEIYIIPVPELWNLTKLKMSFSISRVTFSFNSVLAVSSYSAPENIYGDITSSALSSDGKYIVIKGTMQGATVTKYKGCKLGLYELDAWDDISVIGTLTYGPSAEIDISTKFEFRLPLKSANYMSVFSKYAVAVCRDASPVTPLVVADAPCFVSNISSLAGKNLSAKPQNSFKGICADNDLSYTGAGSVVIDVDLTKLISLKSIGYPHASNGRYYYYNESYTDNIDSLVKAYSLNRSRIILRLLVSNPGREVPFAFSYNQSGVMYYAVNATNSQGQAYLHAAVDFLCGRYSKEGLLISGLSLGMYSDRAGEYNFMGFNVPLAEYAEKYLMALRVVYGTAKRTNAGINIYIPISDDWQNKNIGLRFLYPDYDNSLLLEALCAGVLNEGGAEFSLIVESDKPSYQSAFSDKDNFSDYFKKLSESFPVMQGNPFYIWSPAGSENSDEVCASYAMLYYSFLFDGNADAFTVASRGRVSRLTELVKQIDTVNTLNASVRYMKLLGMEDASGLPSYSPAKAVLRDFTVGSFSYNIPEHTGVFTYSDPSDYEAGSGILDTELSRGVYKAIFDPSSEQHSVICSFTPYEDMTLTGTLGFNIALELAENAEAEVEITVVGAQAARTYTYRTGGGEMSLYADISDLKSASSVKYIIFRVFAPLSGTGSVSIEAIKGYSTFYTSESLEKAIEKLRLDAVKKDDGLLSPVFWAAVVVVLVAFSAITALNFGKSRRK